MEASGQEQNRADARARLAGLIRGAAVTPTVRVKARPTRAAKERRLKAKEQRGLIKRNRQAKSSGSLSRGPQVSASPLGPRCSWMAPSKAGHRQSVANPLWGLNWDGQCDLGAVFRPDCNLPVELRGERADQPPTNSALGLGFGHAPNAIVPYNQPPSIFLPTQRDRYVTRLTLREGMFDGMCQNLREEEAQGDGRVHAGGTRAGLDR
jgi:hypothetical protein